MQNREWETFWGGHVDCYLSAGDWLLTRETTFDPGGSWVQYSTNSSDLLPDHVQVKLVLENNLVGCIPQDPCRVPIAVDHVRVRGL
jgi:hypothetical protein